MKVIYHVTTETEWKTAQQKGKYEASSLHVEGFIHCSTEKQVEGVLERYFSGKTELVKLVIDTDKLSSKLQYDYSEAMKEEFPHVYGPINLDAIIEVKNV